MKLLAVALAVAVSSPALGDNQIKICPRGKKLVGTGITCLHDGDTGWHDGRKWRLVAVDTPEYPPHNECRIEVELAKSATYRTLALLRQGYSIAWLGEKTGDRELARITLTGDRDLGAELLLEGMAVSWPHRRRVWCNDRD